MNSANQDVNWYNPPKQEARLANAVSSISDLPNQYSITAIDIDYENFPTGSAAFTACIGRLITLLKNQGPIMFASIAPFEQTLAVYADLFQHFNTVIDYVN